MLRPISQSGKVYTLKPDLYAPHYDDFLRLRLTGLRKMSTFNGFCSFHDKSLFSPIEDQPFVCSLEQCFLHCYRAVAKESFLKMRQADSMPTSQEYHNLHRKSSYCFNLADLDASKYLALKSAFELEVYKSKLDDIYVTRDFSRIVTRIIEFDKTPTVVCNGNYLPDFDFEGRVIQDHGDITKDMAGVAITVLPVASGGFALFSYLDTCRYVGDRLVDSILRQPNITNALIWLMFCQFENKAMSPTWIESLNPNLVKLLIKTSRQAVDLFCDDMDRLTHCPAHIDDWEPKRIFSL